MKRCRIVLWPVLILWLILSGCRPAAPPVAMTPLTSEALLMRLDANRGFFHSLKGLASIRAEIDGRVTSARQVLLMEKPARLRADVLGLFGQPALQVAVDKGQLAVHVVPEGRYLQGTATAANLARFTRMPLGVDDLVRLALYDVPLIPYGESSLHTNERGYLLRLETGRGDRQDLLFDVAGRLYGVEYFRDGGLLLKVGYERFAEQQGGFPKELSLDMPVRQTSLSLVYSDLELNPELASDHFTLTPPKGIAVERLP
jgi:hypothetical protein